MKMRNIFIVIIGISIMFGQSGYEITKTLDEKSKPKNMISKTTMVLTNSKGKTRNNVMISKTMDNSRRQLIWFLEPKDDSSTNICK